MNYPSGAGGGSGSKYQLCMGNYDYGGNISNYCVSGVYKTGAGGWGGKNTDEGREEVMHYHCMPVPNNHGVGNSWMIPAGPSPRCYPWHDIHEMAGSGSAGRAMFETSYRGPCSWATYGPSNPLAFDNAGEGAGTGGVAYHCCELTSLGFSCFYQGTDACGTVNWTLLCCLGTSGRVCCADKMTDVLFPYILSCAGTLGGSGGTTLCHVASKAGKGGGAGIYRSYITCVCWGGSFDLCNGSGPALAFPPCALDWRVSTAGTGMAVLYWKDTN
jgi:hypothetical protein